MKRKRRGIVRDPQGRELEEWEEEDAFEPNGVLKDGYSLRVPMYMRDSALEWRNEMHSHFLAEDTARRSGISDDTVFITTSNPPMVVDAFGGTEGLNRPGARYLVAGGRTTEHARLATAAAMRDEAYKMYDGEAQNAWRGNASTDTAPMRDTVEQAYLDYDREMSDAWRNAR